MLATSSKSADFVIQIRILNSQQFLFSFHTVLCIKPNLIQLNCNKTANNIQNLTWKFTDLNSCKRYFRIFQSKNKGKKPRLLRNMIPCG